MKTIKDSVLSEKQLTNQSFVGGIKNGDIVYLHSYLVT